MAFTIPESLIRVYQDGIDSIINELGKKVVLIMPQKETRCPNCGYDGRQRRSNGKYNASNPSDLTILKAFTLANQLTINLTNHPELPNPSGGSLYEGIEVEYNGEVWSLGDALAEALQIIANVSDYDDAYILKIKTILDIIANMQAY